MIRSLAHVLLVFWLLMGITHSHAQTFNREGKLLGPSGPGSVTAMAKGPVGSGVVYAAYQHLGIAVSNDSGHTFSMPNILQFTSYTVTCMAVHPTDENVVVAGMASRDGYTHVSMWRSNDGAKTWSPAHLPFGTNDFDCISSIAFNPHNPSILLAGVRARGWYPYNATPILRSTDGAQSFSYAGKSDFSRSLSSTGVSSFLFDPDVDGRVLAGFSGDDSRYNIGLYESLDNGSSWARIDVAPFTGSRAKPIFDLLLVPGTPDKIYAATSAEPYTDYIPLYSSTDGGATWSAATSPQEPFSNVEAFFNIEADPLSSNTLWAVLSPPTSMPEGYWPINMIRYPLMRSVDSGQTWNIVQFDRYQFPLNTSLFNKHLYGLILQGSNEGPHMLAGFNEDGLWRQHSKESDLQPVEFDLPAGNVADVAFAGAQKEKLIAAVSRPLTADRALLVYNRGESAGEWSESLSTTGTLSGVESNPHRPEEVVAIVDGALRSSVDAGATWSAPGIKATALLSGAAETQELYISTPGGLLKSNDFGQTSSPVGLELGYALPQSLAVSGSMVAVAAIPPNNATSLGSGVFVSADGGVTFEKRNNGIRYDNSIAPLSWLTDGTVWGAEYGAIIKSENEGNSWIPQVVQLPLSPYTSSTASAFNPIQFAAGQVGDEQCVWLHTSSMYLHRSLDGGLNWQAIDPEGTTASSSYISHFHVDPTDRQKVIAIAHQVLYKSVDGGESWTTSSRPLANASVQGFAVDPDNSERMYVLLYNGSYHVYYTLNGGATWQPLPLNATILADRPELLKVPAAGTDSLLVTTNRDEIWYGSGHGASWTKVLTAADEISDFASSPSNSIYIYAYDRNGRILKSTNGGLNWTQVGAVPYKYYGQDPAQLTLSPTDANHLLFSCYADTVYRSRDGGRTWAEASPDLRNATVYAVAVHPDTPSIMLAGADAIYKSTDAGLTWAKIDTTRLTWAAGSVKQFVVNPANHNEFLAATTYGILYSSNAGESWSMFNQELAGVSINQLLLSESGGSIDVYAATNTVGVWSTARSPAKAAVTDWAIYE